jgi:hypothetical protein
VYRIKKLRIRSCPPRSKIQLFWLKFFVPELIGLEFDRHIINIEPFHESCYVLMPAGTFGRHIRTRLEVQTRRRRANMSAERAEPSSTFMRSIL